MKTSRALHTDDDVARARRRLAGDPEAAPVLDGILKNADEWAAREDDWLAGIITPASVPRAFNVHHEGCPVHGAEIFKHGGNYSFTFSLDRPFKIVCPVGGEEYPSNDFAAYLATGMTDRSLLTGDYPDDDPALRKPGATGFYNYRGSGYSYIKTPRYGQTAAPWSATWHLKELDGTLSDDRLTLLRLPAAEEELFAGIGLPPQKGNNPPALHYLVSRRTGEALDSTFASVLVPHGEHCPVRSARLLHVGGEAIALAIEREGSTDIVLSSYDPDATLALEPDIVFRGRFGVISLDAGGSPLRSTLFGGGELTAGGQGVRLPGSITGVVTALEPQAGEITVAVDDAATLPDDLSSLLLRELLVSVATNNVPGRDHRSCGLRIRLARWQDGQLFLGFGPQSLQVARLPLHDISAGTAKTVAKLPLAAVGYYDGAFALDDSDAAVRVARLHGDGSIRFAQPVELRGTELRLFEAGPGDRVRIDSAGWWGR